MNKARTMFSHAQNRLSLSLLVAFLASLCSITVASAASYSITYSSGVVSNMPVDDSSSTMNANIAISPSAPTRGGYRFLGWCNTTPTTTDGTDACSGTTYQPNSTYTLDQTSGSNNLSLTAMWGEITQSSCASSPMLSTVVPGITYMQDINSSNKSTVLSAISTGTTYQIKDSRDNETYCIGKLADNNLWLLDNLALDLTNSTILNSLSADNTNINTTSDPGALAALKGTSARDPNADASGKYATAGVVNWTTSYSYSAPLVNLTNKGTIPTDATSTSGGYKVGGYYNYCAASAGSYCYGNGTSAGNSSGNATSDICPKGWRMPTGNTSGEYSALANAIYGSTSSTSDATAVANYRSALHSPLSGYFGSGSASYQGSYGRFWSSTRYGNRSMSSLDVDTSNISPADGVNRYVGSSVRCVLGS